MGLILSSLSISGCASFTPDMHKDLYKYYHIESRRDLKVDKWFFRPIVVTGADYRDAIFNNKNLEDYLRRYKKLKYDVELEIHGRELIDNQHVYLGFNYNGDSSLENKARKLAEECAWRASIKENRKISRETNCENISDFECRKRVLARDIDLVIPLVDKNNNRFYVIFVKVNGI